MKTSTNFAAVRARSTLPGSCKGYFTDSRPDLNIPYQREIAVAQMLPDSGSLPNNEATHPNVTY
jgi:hypothetical protein